MTDARSLWCRCEISSPLAENCTAKIENLKLHCCSSDFVQKKIGKDSNGVYIFLAEQITTSWSYYWCHQITKAQLLKPGGPALTKISGCIKIVSNRKVTKCTDSIKREKSFLSAPQMCRKLYCGIFSFHHLYDFQLFKKIARCLLLNMVTFSILRTIRKKEFIFKVSNMLTPPSKLDILKVWFIPDKSWKCQQVNSVFYVNYKFAFHCW